MESLDTTILNTAVPVVSQALHAAPLSMNSRNEWIDQPNLNEPPLEIDGLAEHWDHRVNDGHYQRPGNLFRMVHTEQRQALFDNTARQIGGAAKHIQERHIANCSKADPAYGASVAAAVLAQAELTETADSPAAIAAE